MRARNRRTSGFTLVEILIVVVILGILAAIVIPQFTSASESAQASNVASQLQTMRSQFQLYQVQHNGSLPDLAQDWEDMTEPQAGPSGQELGPYLQQAPRNPFSPGADTLVDVNDWSRDATSPSNNDAAWEFNPNNGRIRAIVNDNEAVVDALTAAGLRENEDFVTVGTTTTTE